MSWLKMKVKTLKLRRRGAAESDLSTIRLILSRELKCSHQLKGYRSMWHHIRKKYSVIVKRYNNRCVGLETDDVMV